MAKRLQPILFLALLACGTQPFSLNAAVRADHQPAKAHHVQRVGTTTILRPATGALDNPPEVIRRPGHVAGPWKIEGYATIADFVHRALGFR